MIVRSHKTRKLMSVVLMLAIMLSAICFGVPPKVANAAHLTYVEEDEDDYYYIKNVKSGKYMTVQGGSFTSDANIVQWHFTGDNNQKWKLHYTGDTGSNSGFYVFYAFNTNYVIAMPNGSGLSGLQAKLTTPSSCGNRKYFVVTGSLGNAAHRFMTVASNSILALVANNASIYDNTSIVQDQTGVEWSDQWLFEPVGYDNYFGRQYAHDNSEHRLAAYPDFDYYTGNDKICNESINFVSQCLAASGQNYYREGQWLNWWYINKNNHVQNVPFGNVELGQNWTITTSWYMQLDFQNFWLKPQKSCTHSFYEILNPNTYTFLDGVDYDVGDIIVFYKMESGIEKWLLAAYVTEVTDSIQTMQYSNIALHKNNLSYTDTTIRDVILSGMFGNENNTRIRIIHIDH